MLRASIGLVVHGYDGGGAYRYVPPGRGSVQSRDRARTQAVLRYHVGNMLRERYDDDTLAGAALASDSPADKGRSRRHATASELHEARLQNESNGQLRAEIRRLAEVVEEQQMEIGRLRRASDA